MAEAVTRVDRIRRGFNRLGWVVLGVLLLVALLMLLIGAYQGDLQGEARFLALLAACCGVAGLFVSRAFGWVISGFFPDN
ncbi:MAG: hypothetical protein R3D57_18135 [Hyphomicrobiaceae bacterium]